MRLILGEMIGRVGMMPRDYQVVKSEREGETTHGQCLRMRNIKLHKIELLRWYGEECLNGNLEVDDVTCYTHSFEK